LIRARQDAPPPSMKVRRREQAVRDD
jgi:hypothetical protein